MLLSAHEAWYQMQRYKDRFEGLLSIDRLKGGAAKDPPLPSGPPQQHAHTSPGMPRCTAMLVDFVTGCLLGALPAPEGAQSQAKPIQVMSLCPSVHILHQSHFWHEHTVRYSWCEHCRILILQDVRHGNASVCKHPLCSWLYHAFCFASMTASSIALAASQKGK